MGKNTVVQQFAVDRCANIERKYKIWNIYKVQIKKKLKAKNINREAIRWKS